MWLKTFSVFYLLWGEGISISFVSSLNKFKILVFYLSEPVTTARTVNWKTSGSSSDHLTLEHSVSTPGKSSHKLCST